MKRSDRRGIATCTTNSAAPCILQMDTYRGAVKRLRLIRMDPDGHARFGRAAIFCVLPIFRMTAIFALLAELSVASMARENAAGTRKQGDGAY